MKEIRFSWRSRCSFIKTCRPTSNSVKLAKLFFNQIYFMKNTLLKSSRPLGAVALAAIVLTGAGCTQPSGSSSNDQTTAPVSNASYKDGTYTAEGDYTSPGGPEQINVTLTLQNNIVTDATVVPEAQRSMSVHFQGLFTANFKPLVIGQNLNAVHLDAVSGSSLTPKGFNDAIAKIKVQAQA